MDTRLLAIGDYLSAADTNGVLLGLDFQIVFVDTWQLDQRDDVVTLLEYVDWWKTADRSGAASHPVARYA
jgi:hypothetical protein